MLYSKRNNQTILAATVMNGLRIALIVIGISKSSSTVSWHWEGSHYKDNCLDELLPVLINSYIHYIQPIIFKIYDKVN